MIEPILSDSSHNVRVLVVDDSKNSCFLMSEFLRAHAYEVFSLHHESQWLQTLAKLSPDIIVLDLKLYGIDCYALLEQQQQHEWFRNIPTIVVSACTEEIHRRKILALGASSFISKPYLVEQLLHQIELHVGCKPENRFLQRSIVSA